MLDSTFDKMVSFLDLLQVLVILYPEILDGEPETISKLYLLCTITLSTVMLDFLSMILPDALVFGPKLWRDILKLFFERSCKIKIVC